MPLHLPAESRWHAPGSTYDIIPFQGLSHGPNMKRGVCKLKGLHSSEINGSCEEPLSPVGTFGASSLFQPRGIPSEGLASHGKLEFLLAGSSPPNVDGLVSTAIWANCQVGNNSDDLPISPNFSAASTLLSKSLCIRPVSTSGTGGSTSAGCSGSVCTSALVQTWRALLPSPILGIFLVLAILEFERKSAN